MRFEVLKSSLELQGIRHTVYGIVCIDNFNVCHTFSDLSDNLKAVKSFVKNLNTLNPDFSQLEYLIEDFCISPD